MNSTWQESWEIFFDELAKRLRAGDSPVALADYFGGRTVTWGGVLDEKRLDGLAPTVWINFPQKELDLGWGQFAEFAGIGLPVADHSVDDWNRIEVGAQVRFTATLGAMSSPFPAIEIKHLKSGRIIL